MAGLSCVRRGLLLLGLLLLPAIAAADSLRAGWYAGEPQQFMRVQQGREVLTGLDIEMVRAIAARAGHDVTFSRTGYAELLRGLRTGQFDVATGIAETAERRAMGRMSRAYRQDTNVLIVRRGEAWRMVAADAPALLEALRADPGFRLGLRAGFSYVDPALDAFLAEPAQAGRLHRTTSDADNLQHLLAGSIDGFLAERLSVALMLNQMRVRHLVEEAPLRLMVPLHLLFSPEVPQALADAFDAAIAALQAEGALHRIGARFRLPLLMSLTLGNPWFLVLELLGTVAGALAGYLAARHGRYSLFGALVLGAITALAGGVTRDLLVGRHPIGIAGNPIYLGFAFGTVMLAYAIGHAWALLRGRVLLAYTMAQAIVWLRRRQVHSLTFETADAMALAAFTVSGVAVAMGMGVEPLWLWGPILGAMTGAGGGILRDVVRGGGDIGNLRDSLYAEVALGWAVVLSLYLNWRSDAIEQGEMMAAVLVVLVGATLTRLAVVIFGWRPLRLP
jgi:polar amino acid transport system substrate-binding protein